MSINLLELMQRTITSDVVDQAAGILNLDQDQARSAADGILPTLLGGMVAKANTQAGADQLGKVLNQDDGTVLDNLTNILEGNFGGGDRMLAEGRGLLSGLFGDRLDKIVDLISDSSGLSRGGAGSIMSMVTPVIFSLLGRTKTANRLGTEEFGNLLLDQKKHLRQFLPGSMVDSIGIQGFDEDTHTAPVISLAESSQATTTTSTSQSPSRAAAVAATSAAVAGGGAAATSARREKERGFWNEFFRFILCVVVLSALAWSLWTFVWKGYFQPNHFSETLEPAAAETADPQAE